ncbi:MAG: NAD(P)/FAD-dependent oxidoreductase, partial [Ruthenibacterium sp.]
MEENHAQTQFDIAIVGGGPAGLSAAVNARARGKSVVVYGNEEGPLLKTSSVTNYLGFPDVTGPALLETFREHARASGAVLRTGRVLNAATDGESWYLGVGSDVMEATALLLAAGAVR